MGENREYGKVNNSFSEANDGRFLNDDIKF